MAENKYNLRTSTKQKPCFSCNDENEDEIMEDVNILFPDKVVIRPDGATSEPSGSVIETRPATQEDEWNSTEYLGARSQELQGKNSKGNNSDEPNVNQLKSMIQTRTKIGKSQINLQSHSGNVSPSIVTMENGKEIMMEHETETGLKKPMTMCSGSGSRPELREISGLQDIQRNQTVQTKAPLTEQDIPRMSNASRYCLTRENMFPVPQNYERGDNFNSRPTLEMHQNIGLQSDASLLRQNNQPARMTERPQAWGDYASQTREIPRPVFSHTEMAVPKVKLPTFDGKCDWESFWVQFEFFCNQYQWDAQEKLTRLMSSLRDTAMQYVARLPMSDRISFEQMSAALKRRFGDHVLPETHRATLHSLKKNPRESLHEFAARVGELVSKSYPGLEGSQLHTSLTIESLVNGLNDPALIYDVLSKKPQTVDETIDMITWLECCKGSTKRKTGIRQVVNDYDDYELGMRRVNESGYVTEERLNQFQKELEEKLVTSLQNMMNNKKPTGAATLPTESKEPVCFGCGLPGHYKRNCPHPVRSDRFQQGSRRMNGKPVQNKLN